MSEHAEQKPQGTNEANADRNVSGERARPDAAEPAAEPKADLPGEKAPTPAEGVRERMDATEAVGPEPAGQHAVSKSDVPASGKPERREDEAQAAANAAVIAQSRSRTRRSFLVGAGGAAAVYGFYHYLNVAPQVLMQPPPLEDAYETNAVISRKLFPNNDLAQTFPLSRAETLRINGVYGLKMDLEPDSWRLQMVGVRQAATHPRFVKDVTAWEYRYKAPPENEDKGHDTKVDPKIASSSKMAPEEMLGKAEEDENHTGRMPRGMEEAGESDSTLPPGTPGLLLTMEDVLRLPRHEQVTRFNCIEGWSQIVHWAGVRMVDFLEAYPPELIDGAEPRYVYMETPDGDYYVGYDLHVLRHPQTLLVTEMMGAPLTQPHGAPLRLHTPTKYGYKQIKRIGLIAYTNDKPDDYWTKLGYDWYAGL